MNTKRSVAIIRVVEVYTGHNMETTLYSEPKSKGSVIVECRISLMHAVHRYEDNFCEHIMRWQCLENKCVWNFVQ